MNNVNTYILHYIDIFTCSLVFCLSYDISYYLIILSFIHRLGSMLLNTV